MEKRDKTSSTPAPDSTQAPGAPTMSGAIRGDARGMGFSEGEAHLTPNESKGGKKKREGKVEMGSGAVTSIGDVPVGGTARIAALVATERPAKGGLAAEGQTWDEALATSASGLSSRRDQVEALYLAHVQKDPQSAAFKDEHAKQGAEMVSEASRYMTASSRVVELRLVAGASFPLLATAERDFGALSRVLASSGHASESETGDVAVDADRVAKEGAALKVEANRMGVQGMGQQPEARSGLKLAYTQFTTVVRTLTNLAFTMRRDSLTRRSGERKLAAEVLQARVAAADAIDGLVMAAAEALPVVGQFVQGSEASGLDAVSDGSPSLPSLAGLVTRLIAGSEVTALRRVQAELAGLATLHQANDAQQDVEAIRVGLATFATNAECFIGAIESDEQRNQTRHGNLDAGGVAMDRNARSEKSLDSKHERFRPIAQRVAHLESARSSNALGQAALNDLGASASSASEGVDAFRTAPTANLSLFDLRPKIEANVPQQLTRRITRFRAQLEEQATVVAAASKERA